MRKLVCFFVGDRELAAPIGDVRETVALRPITPLFGTPSAIAGITNLRGEILAVLDPGVLLGLGPAARADGSRIVIVQPDDRAAGLLVDRLGPIRDVPADDIGPVPPTVPPRVAALLEGVVSLPDRPVGVLGLRRLLGAPDLLPFVRERREAAEATASDREAT